MSRFLAALLAGAGAIALNTMVLQAADFVPLATDHGGLLRLLMKLTVGVIDPPISKLFKVAFHTVVGIAMAQFYAFALEPFLRGPSWVRGLSFATTAWLANAILVLPAIGDGIAGYRVLSLAGIAWFAAAHYMFFVLLAVFYARFQKTQLLERNCTEKEIL